MKTTNRVLIFGALLIAGQAYAQNNLSYDLYGVYATRDNDGHEGGRFGIGLGVNYFFTENMGVGADSYAASIDWPYLLNASFIYRFSELKPVTPYAYAGFGRQWEHAPQWTGHFGGGAEYELSMGRSIFVDARLVVPADTGNYGVVRLGARLSF